MSPEPGRVAVLPADAEIEPRFADIVAKSLRVEPDVVAGTVSLYDLGADSIDFLDISLGVEDVFDVLLPERDILRTAEDVFGEGVLTEDRTLTDEGMRLLRARVPDLDVGSSDRLSVADARRAFFRVDVWVRMIRGLMEASPRRCGACGVPLVKSTPGRLQCPACGLDHDLPSGDDLNRQWVERYRAEREGGSAG